MDKVTNVEITLIKHGRTILESLYEVQDSHSNDISKIRCAIEDIEKIIGKI